MKITVVLIFFLAISRVLKNSRGFSRFFRCYEGRYHLVDEKPVFQSVLDHFRILVIGIVFWLTIASFCVILLALGT
jgi:hypothetical protein